MPLRALLLCSALLCAALPLSDLSFPFAFYTTLHYTIPHTTPSPSPSPNAAQALAHVIILPAPWSHLLAWLPTSLATNTLRLHGIFCAKHRPASMKVFMLIKMLMAMPHNRWVAAKARYEYDHLAQRRPSPSEH